MENVFAKKRRHADFSWDCLGDILEGRGELGDTMPVMIYRLMQYTLLAVLTKGLGAVRANEYFRKAGLLAGREFARNMLDISDTFGVFFDNLQTALYEMKIGVLRMEAYDRRTGDITLTIGQDLDCSGLSVTNENICHYDEGFIAGILEAYTGRKYNVQEIDCWASGKRLCRFKGIAVP